LYDWLDSCGRSADLLYSVRLAVRGLLVKAPLVLDSTTVIDREQDRPTRWIKEAVHSRKEGHRAMNGDEGSYQLSHAYDRLLNATADRRIKTRKN